MANGTTVSPQATDATTQTNVMVVGLAPAMAMGSLYETLSYSMGLAALNAVFAQQQTYINYQASTAKEVEVILSTSVS